MSRPGLTRAGSTRAVENKTIVLVSGGNSGVGFEIVKQLAQLRSDFQILLGCRNVSKGEQAAAAMGAPINVNPIHLDINDDQSVDHCAMAIEQHFGRLDVLINNASSTGNDLVQDGHVPSIRDIWSHITKLNVSSTGVVTEKMIPLLEHSKAPKIIFMSNELASFSKLQESKKPVTSSMLPFVVSKAAVNMMAMQLALQHPKITVNCAAPAEQDSTDGSDETIAKTVIDLATSTSGNTGTFVTATGQIAW